MSIQKTDKLLVMKWIYGLYHLIIITAYGLEKPFYGNSDSGEKGEFFL